MWLEAQEVGLDNWVSTCSTLNSHLDVGQTLNLSKPVSPGAKKGHK